MLRGGTLVHSHVIHQHGLREDGGGVRVSRPASANCDVQQQEEGMVVDPLCSFGQVGGSAGGVEVVIDVEADGVRFPFDGEDVKVVGKALVGGKREGRADTVCAGISGAVDGAVNQRGLFADVFHDVDFSAGGPAGFVDVDAEHPEGGPDALSARNLHAGFEAAVGLG